MDYPQKELNMLKTVSRLAISCWLILAVSCPADAYVNPILPYDYSDPDVVAVGRDYYMTASSFASIPGLQILHSTDMIHWTLVDAALRDAVPGYEDTDACPAGGGVWAPSIRYHAERFYIFYGDPDKGIYCVRSEPTRTIPCRWEPAVLVKAGKGLIDPCPLWDTDGRVYLVHAYAGSRAGFKSALAVCELTSDALQVLTPDRLVFDGHPDNPTCEGPKFYKRGLYYYIFCPAGGVATGWQLCMRSRSPYGPYEVRRVLEQGNTVVNGPHQGAWVGQWFLHFQDVGVAGRIVHLQPLSWSDDWPIIGRNGTPVSEYPVGGRELPQIAMRDEFSNPDLNLSWQWSCNRKAEYAFVHTEASFLRLFSYPADSLQTAPNMLLQKIPAGRAFRATARVRFTPYQKNADHERAGLVVFGRRSFAMDAPKDGEWIYLRVEVSAEQKCQFYRSEDGDTWQVVGSLFQAVEGEWTGARVGLFCTRDRAMFPNGKPVNDSGYLDVDWFEIEGN